MFDALVPFTVGLLGSLHCVGMCGPLVIACSLPAGGAVSGNVAVSLRTGTILRQVAFHAGRVLSYGLLGAIAAGLFYSIEVQRFTALYRGSFMTVSGLVLIGMGLILAGILPLPGFITGLAAPGRVGRAIASLARSPNPLSGLGMGAAAGLLPCGLSWAMLVNAAGTLDPAKGFLTMAAFGLGTVPLLFLAGTTAGLLSARVRVLGEKAAAGLIIITGTVMLIKGGTLLLGFADHCH